MVVTTLAGAGDEAGVGSPVREGLMRVPQPVTRYWITTPIRLEATQYRASPLGKLKEKKVNMRGSIHSIMLF